MSVACLRREEEPALVPRALRITLPVQPVIRVAVVSEDRLLREVLAAALARHEDLELLQTAAPGEEAAMDVALIDAGRDLRSALARTRKARERWPAARLIVIGLEREDEAVVDFIEAGAGGYVLKGSSPEDLVAAIRAARQDLAVCGPQVLSLVLARTAALSQAAGPAPVFTATEPLTGRETEILALLAAGLTNKEAGRRLRITVQTVKNHVHRILEKLRVHRRRDAVRRAYELGLLAEPLEGDVAVRLVSTL